MEKRNFYFKNVDINNEVIEVYVGKNSGKQLNNDILNAKEEILIVSPYIDETKLDELIELKNKGIKVLLIFSDLRKKQKPKILKKLITQNQYINRELKEKLEKDKKRLNTLYTIALILGVLLTLFSIFNFKNINLIAIITFLLGMTCFLVLYIIHKKKHRLEKVSIYNYDYSKNMNFKFLRNNFKSKNEMFVHSKIYIIDRKIAYLGSINFTVRGFTSNFETRIRITESDKINDLVKFINNISDDTYNFTSHKLSFLGKQVYDEQ